MTCSRIQTIAIAWLSCSTLAAQAVNYSPKTREIWNNKVLISWQNIVAWKQNNSRNLFVDVLKYDDDKDGNPRNDANRVLPSSRSGNATGIEFSLDTTASHIGDAPAGIVRKNSNGSFSLVLSRTSTQTGNSSARIEYTVSPGTAVIAVKIAITTGKRVGNFSWGLNMKNSIWVTTKPGVMTLYDRATISNPLPIYRAQTTTSCTSAKKGRDYWTLPSQSTGYTGLVSTKKKWTTGIALTRGSSPVDFSCYLLMNSKYCGWSFQRIARFSSAGLSPNRVHTFDAFVYADSSASFSGLAALTAGAWKNLGVGCSGWGNFTPVLTGQGGKVGQTVSLSLTKTAPNSLALFALGLSPAKQKLACGSMYLSPIYALGVYTSGSILQPGSGRATYQLPTPPFPSLAGLQIRFQALVLDIWHQPTLCLSNGMGVTLYR